MSKAKERYENWKTYHEVFEVSDYVNELEETRKLVNQIITQLYETRTELFKIILADLKRDWEAWSYIGGSLDQFKKDHSPKVSVIEKITEWDIEEVLRGN